MNPANDATPRRSTATSAAPSIAHFAELRRSERLSRIFEQKYEHLCLLAIRYLDHSAVFAEDIVADVFEDALSKWPLEAFDKIRDLEGYICKCVINRSKNTRRRNKRLINIHDLPFDTFSTPNPMANLDLDIDVLAKLLPPKQSEAFSLYLKGYAHEEIAQMMGLSGEGASKNLIYYAKKKLRKLWEEQPDPDDPAFSPTRKKADTRAGKRPVKPVTGGPGDSPRLRDLLNYLQENELRGPVRRNIRTWLMKNPFAGDVISGLNIALQHQSGEELENRLRRSKNSLRARLFGNLGETGSLNMDLKASKNSCDLPNKISNIYPRLIIPTEKPPFIIVRPGAFVFNTCENNIRNVMHTIEPKSEDIITDRTLINNSVSYSNPLFPCFTSVFRFDILGDSVSSPIKPDETLVLPYCVFMYRPYDRIILKMKKGKKKSVETI